jgi:hypothetical protein
MSKWEDGRRYYCEVCGDVDRYFDSLAMDRAMEERSGFWDDE